MIFSVRKTSTGEGNLTKNIKNKETKMKKLIVLLMVIALAGCIQIVQPTEMPTNTPVPTSTPEPTKVPEVAGTPDPNEIASEFIYTFADFFWYFEEVYQDPPIGVELLYFGFTYVNDNELYLVMETKSSDALVRDKTALVQSIAALTGILTDDWELPKDIDGVWFVQANNDLVILEMYYLDWDVLMAYVDGDITTEQMLEELQVPETMPSKDINNS